MRANKNCFVVVDLLEPRALLAAGDIDPTFARVAASVSLPPTTCTQPEAIDVAFDADGSAVMLARAYRSGNPVTVLTRVLSRGNVDRAFGQAGLVELDLGLATYTPRALAVDSSGNVSVLADAKKTAASTSVVVVTQLSRKGKINTSFGTAGSASPAVKSAADIAVNSTGRWFVLGTNGKVAKLNPNGSPETSFGIAGVANSRRPGTDGTSVSLALSGSKLLVGSTLLGPGGTDDFSVARLLGNGVLDGAFGRYGVATFDQPGQDELDAVTGDSSGRVLLSGKRSFVFDGEETSDSTGMLMRLTSSGRLDTSFAGDGVTDSVELTGSAWGCKTHFGDAPALIAQTGSSYHFFAGLRHLTLDSSGKVQDVGGHYSNSSWYDPRDGYFGVATRAGVMIAIGGYEPYKDWYATAGHDARVVMLERFAGTATPTTGGLPLVSGFEATGVGIDGSLVTVSVPQCYDGVRTLVRYDRNGVAKSYQPLTVDPNNWYYASVNGLHSGTTYARSDGQYDLTYSFTDVQDGDGGAYANYVVNSAGTPTPQAASNDETWVHSRKRLPFDQYALTYSDYMQSNHTQIFVNGQPSGFEVKWGPLYGTDLRGYPKASVPVYGSSDRFVKLETDSQTPQQLIARFSGPTTLSPLFSTDGLADGTGIDPFYGDGENRLLYTKTGTTGLRRLKSDGTPDTSFGSGGVMASGFDHFDIDHHNRLIAWRVLKGGVADGDVQIRRYNANGRIDTTFGGGDGLIVVDAKLPSTANASVVVTPNDNLVVTAYRQSATAISWSATRILGA